MIAPAFKKWLAIGSGVGVSVEGPRGGESLQVTAVRVRPGGARVLGGFTIEDFAHQPAADWGAAISAFTGKLGLRQAPVMVVLPRHEVILRQLTLPGVSDQDLDGAVQFQIDSLHPWDDGDVLASWARLPGTDTVAVAVARRETISRYTTLFAEAGVRLAGFTCSAVAVHSGLRLFGGAPAGPVLASQPAADGGMEVYGESPARPLFSATFEGEPGRAAELASAELRFEETPQPLTLAELVGAEPPLSYAAALASSCPHNSLPLNLLPVEQRPVRSNLRWAVTAALAVVAVLGAIALALLPGVEDNRYLAALNQEIAKVQPEALRASELDTQIESLRARTLFLDDLRRRSKADMDLLAELTRLLPPPTWLTSLELDRERVTVAGQTNQAAPLLSTIDSSPLFESSEFNGPPTRTDSGESFRIRTRRQTTPVVETAQASPEEGAAPASAEARAPAAPPVSAAAPAPAAPPTVEPPVPAKQPRRVELPVQGATPDLPGQPVPEPGPASQPGPIAGKGAAE